MLDTLRDKVKLLSAFGAGHQLKKNREEMESERLRLQRAANSTKRNSGMPGQPHGVPGGHHDGSKSAKLRARVEEAIHKLKKGKAGEKADMKGHRHHLASHPP